MHFFGMKKESLSLGSTYPERFYYVKKALKVKQL
jgi:hypothetical protein